MIGTLTVLLGKLTGSQSGRLVVVGVLCLFAGAVGFSATEHVGFGTALYWAITTATTVGYGDVTPKNPAGRVIASAVMLTTIPLFASAFAIFAGAVATAHLRRLLGMEHRDPTGREIVIYGMHPALPATVHELVDAGREVVVVTAADTSALPEAVRVINADPTSEAAIRRGRPDRASQVLIAGADDATVLVTAVLVHEAAPGIPALAIASSPNVRRALGELGVEAAVSGDELLSHALAKSLEAPHAGELLLRIMDSEAFALRELPLEPALTGQKLSTLRGSQRGMVLGAVHDGRVVMGVTDDPILTDQDRLLILQPKAAARD